MATKSLCLVEGCGKPLNAKGYCRNHYYRFRMHGDPLSGKAAKGEPLAWIKQHVNHDSDECLIWPFARFANGYGAACDTNASNIMCQEAYGPAPDDAPFALHSCGNGSLGCVHPKHLRWGTQAENMQDSVEDGTRCRGESQHYHKLTEDNVRDIRRLRGVIKQKDIASQFGIDPETVRRIQKRQAWAWLS